MDSHENKDDNSGGAAGSPQRSVRSMRSEGGGSMSELSDDVKAMSISSFHTGATSTQSKTLLKSHQSDKSYMIESPSIGDNKNVQISNMDVVSFPTLHSSAAAPAGTTIQAYAGFPPHDQETEEDDEDEVCSKRLFRRGNDKKPAMMSNGEANEGNPLSYHPLNYHRWDDASQEYRAQRTREKIEAFAQKRANTLNGYDEDYYRAMQMTAAATAAAASTERKSPTDAWGSPSWSYQSPSHDHNQPDHQLTAVAEATVNNKWSTPIRHAAPAAAAATTAAAAATVTASATTVSEVALLAQIEHLRQQLAHNKEALAKKNEQLAEKEEALAEKEMLVDQLLAQKDEEFDGVRAELEQKHQYLLAAEWDKYELRQQVQQLKQQLQQQPPPPPPPPLQQQLQQQPLPPPLQQPPPPQQQEQLPQPSEQVPQPAIELPAVAGLIQSSSLPSGFNYSAYNIAKLSFGQKMALLTKHLGQNHGIDDLYLPFGNVTVLAKQVGSHDTIFIDCTPMNSKKTWFRKDTTSFQITHGWSKGTRGKNQVRAIVAIHYTCPDELVSGVKEVINQAFCQLKKMYESFESFRSTENSVIRGQMLELLQGDEMQRKLVACGCTRLDRTQVTSKLWNILTYQIATANRQDAKTKNLMDLPLPCLCLHPECMKKRQSAGPHSPFMVSGDCINRSLNVRQSPLGPKFDGYDDHITMVTGVLKSEGHSFSSKVTPRLRAAIVGFVCGSPFGNDVLQKVIDEGEGNGKRWKRKKNHRTTTIDKLWAEYGPGSDDRRSLTQQMLNGVIHTLVNFQKTVSTDVAALGLNGHVCYYVSDCSRVETSPGSGRFRIDKYEQYAFLRREDSILRQRDSGETWGDKVHDGYDGYEHGKLPTVVLVIPAQNGIQSRLIESYIYRFMYFTNPGSVLNQKDNGNAVELKSYPCVAVTAVLVGEGMVKGMLALNKKSRRAARRRLLKNMPEGMARFVYPKQGDGSKRDTTVYDDVSDGDSEQKEFEDWENDWD